MALFGLGKKKSEKDSSCCENCTLETMEQIETKIIQLKKELELSRPFVFFQ